MDRTSPWRLLRGEEADQVRGLRLIQDKYIHEPDADSSIINLGVAQLWLERNAEAFVHFQTAIANHRTTISKFYGMCGVAKWCLGETAEAISIWRMGLKARYADTAGLGLAIPLLLFLASAIAPDSFDRVAAKDLLAAKTKDSRIKHWPGAIARFLVGEISESELRSCSHDSNAAFSRVQEWHADLYLRLNTPGDDILAFKTAMTRTISITNVANSDDEVFGRVIRHEEYFLVRHESRGALGVGALGSRLE